MPHLTLEFTRNLGPLTPEPRLFAGLHDLLESTAGIRKENCKSRWRVIDDWLIGGEEGEAAFVHLSVRFLEGRSDRAKERFGRGALELLRSPFAAAETAMMKSSLWNMVAMKPERLRSMKRYSHPGSRSISPRYHSS